MKYLVIALVLMVTVLAECLSALECIGMPLQTVVAQSEIVLFGRVEAAQIVDDKPYYYIATVRVVRLWKGTTPTTIELAQPPVVGGMDLTQHVGATYLFFARRLSPAAPMRHPSQVTSGYTAYECVSKQLSTAEDLSRELGKGYPPEEK